jgi:ABC-type cobalt transport system substrate-binding protein
VKAFLIGLMVLVAVVTILVSGWMSPDAKWSGVDESVVEKFARAAGRPPSEPLLNIDQGDLPLFLFLLAGVVGGFFGGYYYRHLFPPDSQHSREESNV